jgi:putative transposase
MLEPCIATNYKNKMATAARRLTFKMYPSATQLAVLEAQSELLRQLYNGALEERIAAFRRAIERHGKGAAKGLTLGSQEKSVTEIRRIIPEYGKLHTHACQVVLKRLQRAYENFFRRVKDGAEEAGFPRFKSKNRWRGFGYKEHGNGFTFTPKFDGDGNWKHGAVRLSGIGFVPVRGEARTLPGRILDCSLMRKADGWFLSMAVEYEPQRFQSKAASECGLDWGVETFAALAYEDEDGVDFDAVPNDRLLAQEAEAIKVQQRALSKALRGKKSKRAAKRRRAMARLHRKVANRRKARNHQVTADLVRDHSFIVTEDLAVTNMTATARGTVEDPGSRVAQKAGLNRAILDASPGAFVSMLAYKAEEAGCELLLLDPRKHRPSQTCPSCLRVEKKSMSDRKHRCGCGFIATRDQASALHLLRVGRELTGREPRQSRREAA